MRSLFPWMGGKSRLAKKLAGMLPEHKCYVEVFSGAANLLFAKDGSETEVINDINDEVSNLFRIARFHPRELVRELQFFLHSRRDYESYRSQRGLTDIQKAARSWLIFRGSFGGKGGCYHPAYGYAPSGFRGLKRNAFSLLKACHKRLDGVYIENLDFTRCIAKYDRSYTLFYCDPPYLKTEGYKHDFGIKEHRKLRNILRKIKGRFILSINDNKDIHAMYRGFKFKKINTKYSLPKEPASKAARRSELIITSFTAKNQKG